MDVRLCVCAGVDLGDAFVKMISHIESTHEVFLHYELSYGVKVSMDLEIVYHIYHTDDSSVA